MATKEDLSELILKIGEGINRLPPDTPVDKLENLKVTLEGMLNSLPAAEVLEGEGDNLSADGRSGGRRRSAKKRGTQRKQKRRQRRGSRRAY